MAEPGTWKCWCTQLWNGISFSSAGWQPWPWGADPQPPTPSLCSGYFHPGTVTASLSSLKLFWLAWILFPKISLTGENVFLWSSLERQIPLWSAVCCTRARASLCVSVSVCSMSLLPLLCSKYSSFNEAKFFNYYFSLWNGSWSLGLLILSDWKGKKIL